MKFMESHLFTYNCYVWNIWKYYYLLKKGEVEDVKLEFERLVVVGANGAGKTRFGSWIEEHNYEKVHRISAQKSLSMPFSVRTTSMKVSKEDLLYGTHNDNKDLLKHYGQNLMRRKNGITKYWMKKCLFQSSCI